MTRPTAVYLDCSPYMRRFLTPALLDRVPGLIIGDGVPSDEATIAERVSGHHAVMFGEVGLATRHLDANPGLKLVVFLGSGPGFYIDLAECERRGITVRRVPGYGDRTIAEHAFALALAVSRRIVSMDVAVRAGRWLPEGLGELGGKTLGIVGLGGIGRAMATLARGFGMRVIAYNRTAVPDFSDGDQVPLDRLMAESDVVSIHLALTDQTRGLIDGRRLALMKPTAILVNTARAAIVDQAAMIEALTRGRIAGAGLDVFDPEPLPTGHPLTKLDSVTLTAHSAWMSPEATARLLTTGIDLLAEGLDALRGDFIPGRGS